MWIVSVDTPCYPWIARFETYDKAKEFYDECSVAKNKGEEECVFISQVKEYRKTDDYTLLED